MPLAAGVGDGVLGDGVLPPDDGVLPPEIWKPFDN
jgi:hypothetical protein